MTTETMKRWMHRLVDAGWVAKLNRRNEIRMKDPNGKIFTHCPITAMAKHMTGHSYHIHSIKEAASHMGKVAGTSPHMYLFANNAHIAMVADGDIMAETFRDLPKNKKLRLVMLDSLGLS